MKILFCSRLPLSRELGASKVLVELAEAMRAHGWSCDMLDAAMLGISATQSREQRIQFSQRLREKLHSVAGDYDVVDYDHEDLPFARAEFSPNTLMVARSVLLVHHLETLRIPDAPLTLRSLMGKITKGPGRAALTRWRIDSATTTMREADLVNVSNIDDAKALHRIGIAPKKIVVLPFGLSEARRRRFEAIREFDQSKSPRVAFVGTFDYRKGASDFPHLVKSILKRVPEAEFRLLGTGGLFATRQRVLAHFPERLHGKLEVLPKFPADELPARLADCAVGVFPSYLEGFPFGVLEMLAAGLPVIAYDAPGPPEMLPGKWLVRPGDATAMAERVVELLQNSSLLQPARQEAQQRSRPFSWGTIARQTIEKYELFRQRLLGNVPACASQTENT